MRVTLLVGTLLASPPTSAAQTPHAAHLDATLVNGYVWRGIRRAGGANAQLQLRGQAGDRLRLQGGVWGNFELSTHRNGGLTDLVPGRWGVSEYDVWIEGARSFGAADLALGGIWYQYRGAAGHAGTGEVYARLQWTGTGRLHIAPELSIWYDPVRRNAGYAEAGVTAPVLALPFLSPLVLAYTRVSAGLAVGRAKGGPPFSATWFRETGLTQGELTVGIRTRSGPVVLNLAGQLQYARDSATRRRRREPPESSGDVRARLILEGGLSWSLGSRR